MPPGRNFAHDEGRQVVGPFESDSLKYISDCMDDFVRQNGWYERSTARPQTARNLAISVAIEAAELLECYQWQDDAATEHISGELADVFLYLIQLARVTKVDLGATALEKLRLNANRTWPSERVELA